MARLAITAPKRDAVADALGRDDDVGNDAVRLERPEAFAGSPDAGLDLVDDADAAGGADPLEGPRHIAFGHRYDAAVALYRLDDHPGQAAAGLVVDGALDLIEIGLDAFAVNAAILVGLRHEGDPAQLGNVVAEAGDAGQRLGAEGGAVIAGAQRQHVDIAGICACHQQCQVDRFGTAVGEVHDPVMAGGHGRRQFLRIVRGHRMVEHGRAVGKLGELFGGRLDHRWMGMADRDAQVHAQQVDILLAGLVPDILAATTLDDERFLEWHELALRGRIEAVAARDDAFGRPVDRQGGWNMGCVHRRPRNACCCAEQETRNAGPCIGQCMCITITDESD